MNNPQAATQIDKALEILNDVADVLVDEGDWKKFQALCEVINSLEIMANKLEYGHA